jgi:cytochrome oxidase assembly protein ShyY1
MAERKAVPLVPTLIVLLAVLAMIGLGVWQLDRRTHKEAMLSAYRANMGRPAATYPANPVDDAYLFRTLRANCLRVVAWQVLGGRSASGKAGWRHIATCATGIEGPGTVIDMGVSTTPDAKPIWKGGIVQGLATHEPDESTFIERLTGKAMPLRLMIVSAQAAPGLEPSQRPDPQSVPNNHLAYAVQWFLFAGVAIIVYIFALRRRWKDAPPSA